MKRVLNKKSKKKGFTLIELIAVIAIIGILAAILVPKVTGYMLQAKKTKVVDQARKVVTAVESYDLKRTTKLDRSKTVSALKGTAGVKDLLSDESFANIDIANTTVKHCYDIVQGQADFDFVAGSEVCDEDTITAVTTY